MSETTAVSGASGATSEGPASVIGDIVEEHFEELDFLCEQREGVLFAPDWDLEELAELEERAEAHLDGLRVAGGHAIDLARPMLFEAEASARTAATLLFMDTGNADLAKEVLEAFDQAEDHEVRDGIRIGLRHSTLDLVRDGLRERADGDDESLAVCASDVLAFHRDAKRPDVGRWLTSGDPMIRELALGCMGRRREFDAPDSLNAALADEERAVQMAALRAAAMSGMTDLASLCRIAAKPTEAPNLSALAFLGVVGDESDLPRCIDAVAKPEQAPAALMAIGALGRIDAIPTLIDAMSSSDEATALAAGEAFVRIVGPIDIEADLPEDDASGQDAEAEGADSAEEEFEFDDEFEEDALLPDPEKARAWWEENEVQFQTKVRFQNAVDIGNVEAALPLLPLASRRDLYLGHCAQLGTAAPDIELESWVSRDR